MTTIQRIRSLELENFKGFGCQTAIDTDADIVLITGANGYGKTTFLEALTAILTGYHPYDDPIGALVPVGITDTSNRCTIRIRTQIHPRPEEGGPSETFAISWDCKGVITEPRGPEDAEPVTIQQLFPRPQAMPLFLTGKPQQYELHARLCAFFQERVTFQYDQGVKGDTVRDVIKPVPTEISRIIDKLTKFTSADGIPSQIDRLQKRYSSPKSEEEIRHELAKSSSEFMVLYNAMAKWRGDEWPPGPPSFDRGDLLSGFVRDLLERRGIGVSYSSKATADSELAAMFETSLKRSLNDWVADAGKRAAEETEEGRTLQRRLDVCMARIREIETTHPELAEEVALFEPNNPRQECDALTLLRTLVENAGRWAAVKLKDSDEQEQGKLQEVLAEFARVDESRAAACRTILDNWYGRKKKFWRELCSLREEKIKLDEEIALFSISEEVEEAKRIRRGLNEINDEFSNGWKAACQLEREIASLNQRMERAAALKRHNQAAHALLEALAKVVNLSDENLDKLATIVRGVAKRFSLVEGMLPREKMEVIKLPKGSGASGGNKQEERIIQRLKTDDGREMVHFSTGQKAQLGISLLVAQNLYLSNFLPHRIILLDDLTTAYDLANLSREAILWRQLAYGQEPGDPLARQVFISTHHEELTNKLLELLVPPAGRTLRVVKFCDYSKEKGPKFELFKVEPTASSKSCQALAKELQGLSSSTN